MNPVESIGADPGIFHRGPIRMSRRRSHAYVGSMDKAQSVGGLGDEKLKQNVKILCTFYNNGDCVLTQIAPLEYINI